MYLWVGVSWVAEPKKEEDVAHSMTEAVFPSVPASSHFTPIFSHREQVVPLPTLSHCGASSARRVAEAKAGELTLTLLVRH